MACVADDFRKTYIMIEPFFLGFGLGFSLILCDRSAKRLRVEGGVDAPFCFADRVALCGF